MSMLEQHTDLNCYPCEGIRREYRRTVYGDGTVVYDMITETDKRYDSVELSAAQYHERLSKAMKYQRKMEAKQNVRDDG